MSRWARAHSAWFQYLMHPRYRAGSPVSKRAFDLVVGSLMLIALAPVLAAFAIAIKLTDGGPVFYRQSRVGEGGVEFAMIKLRSMRVAAEDARRPVVDGRRPADHRGGPADAPHCTSTRCRSSGTCCAAR